MTGEIHKIAVENTHLKSTLQKNDWVRALPILYDVSGGIKAFFFNVEIHTTVIAYVPCGKYVRMVERMFCLLHLICPVPLDSP